MEKNIFENAKYGDRFLCRNGTIAYYGRYNKKQNKHFLMTQDEDNDYILAYNDGHVFHINTEWRHPRTGKTLCETYGWNYDELKDYHLDIVSRYQEPIDEAKLDELAREHFFGDYEFEYDGVSREEHNVAYKAGYRKAKEE